MPSPKNSSLVGLDTKPPLTYPLIELFGDIDVGKRVIGEALARKLVGKCLTFPQFNSGKSLTGLTLMTCLGNETRLLEENPYWWSHLYIANLLEHETKIKEFLKVGPVIVINWVTAARLYFRITTGEDSSITKGIISGLTTPDLKFIIKGDKYTSPGNFPVNLSSKFKFDLTRALMDYNKCQHIRVEYKGSPTICINKAADTLESCILRKRPDLKVKSFHYPNGYF